MSLLHDMGITVHNKRSLDRTATRIVCLNEAQDDYGVYHDYYWNSIDTPLVFRGTLVECIEWRKA